MAKVQVEFINTCSCCDVHGDTIKKAAEKYGDEVEIKLYYAGKDFDYIKKYGMINKGTMIINGRKKIESLSKEVIENAIEKAMQGA